MTNYHHNLNEPPECGELSFSFNLEPVSLQSSSSKRKFVKSEIKKITSTINYLLSGDVKIEIQWLTNEQERYESANALDIDNIIKPILDGLSGPTGILIDDCQVQRIGSHWIDWTKHEHQLNITIQFTPDVYVTKKNLIFLGLEKNLFIPMHSDLPWNHKEAVIDCLEKAINLKEELLSLTKDYHQAKIVMPVQRFFHKSRINNEFIIIEKDEFRKHIENEKAKNCN